MNQAPWTEIGRLQSDVSDIKRKLYGKVQSYELDAVKSRVDSLEHSLRELSSKVDDVFFRLQDAEDKIIQAELTQLKEANEVIASILVLDIDQAKKWAEDYFKKHKKE